MAYRYPFIAAWLLLALALPACSQDEGETCQLDRDCADGLICVRARGFARGSCADPAEIDDNTDTGGSTDMDAAALPDDLDAAAPAQDAGDEDTDAGAEPDPDIDAG